MKKNKIEQLLQSENEDVKKLHEIVLNSVKEEELIASKIYGAEEKLSRADSLADKVAEFGGSWRFIIFFFVMMILWICLNVYILKSKPLDPYPFILMNLILSCIAALQAPIIMMSQNRKEIIDRKRAENDYLINLKAEIEIRNLHQKINLLMEEQLQKLMETQSIEIKLLQE